MLGCNTNPKIEDLYYVIDYNESINKDLIYIHPEDDQKYQLGEEFYIHESNDTMYIKIYSLKRYISIMPFYWTLIIGKGYDYFNFEVDSTINYICIQDTFFSVDSIRRKPTIYY